MPRTGLWLRVFIGLLLAVMPPLLMLSGALLITGSALPQADPNVVAILVVIAAVGWAAMLAIVFTGGLADDFRSLMSLAERGEERLSQDLGAAHQQLAASLAERNRQVATLAERASMVPIDDEPRAVVASLVSAVRLVIRDATWRMAVLASPDETLLPAGVYRATEDEDRASAIGDLERWASTAGSTEPVRRAEGPWGAFTTIDVAVSDRLRAILYAPWEGRADPTPAEIDLLTLVGQHAGTALEHSLLYSQVRSQADELNRLANVQADFLRGVTHDLQTPLTSIGALATELHADVGIPDRARADLDSITHQADRLRRMVSQLLIASRLEAGVFTPQQEIFAVQPIIERTWAALRADRPFELNVEGAPHLAIADPDRLEQTLWALLDNAVKYSPKGSPISVRIAPADGRLEITVEDRGAGMDEVARTQAFEQFYRSAEARQLAPDGSGVGLYAARGIVEAMGGAIEIASRPGRGTQVTLSVPAEPSGGSDE